ncbi:solute carrier organic anion transporter family member 4C1-like isoform X2 [Lethenteron reissneri]|uniref:solute carrier organic anion transporter family member 4C1-like isoform X2 n=1 Tax=Lethenteron reissneri TaxID=7753 RepID=UPI002AB6A454|nr:solute carrier organic anion transporter family member 4C1-like isoform X2 [Lethenteron reissneri]
MALGGVPNPAYEQQEEEEDGGRRAAEEPAPAEGRSGHAGPEGDEAGRRRKEEREEEEVEEEEEEAGEGPCGWWRVRPSCLQVCNNPKGYLLFFGLMCTLQGAAVNGLVNVSITTIEQRFDLSSSLMGLVAAGYDIAFCVCTLPVTFLGGRGHKPRWLALGAVVMGAGSLVFALPHFTVGPYRLGDERLETCSATRNSSSCPPPGGGGDAAAPSLSAYLFVFVLGQLLHGAGCTPLYTLGTAFMDESVTQAQSSLYIGIAFGMSALGPAIGYVAGGQLLNIYIDVDRSGNAPLSPSDSRWLGAWWIGFIVACLLSWAIAVPLFAFPRSLPGSARLRARYVSQAHQDGSEEVTARAGFGSGWRDFPTAFKLLVKNAVFMCVTVAGSTEGLVVAGFITFMPKFIENQFGQTSSFAALLGGLVSIPGAVVGQVLGGLLVSKLHLSCRRTLLLASGSSLASLALCAVFYFASCENAPFAGVTQPYNGSGEALLMLEAECNAPCGCERSLFAPVCTDDGVQFFSACYAGCTTSIPQGFANCSCVGLGGEGPSVGPSVEQGKCGSTCTNMPLFLGIFLLVIIFTFISNTPAINITLRCVPASQRSFALGVQWLFIRALGTIPGPILFGVIIDKTCILWSEKPCGERGACWTYDNPTMSLLLLAIGACCKVVTIVFFLVAFFVYKGPAKTAAPADGADPLDSSHLPDPAASSLDSGYSDVPSCIESKQL